MTNTARPVEMTGYYLQFLKRLHDEIRPRSYLEIGVHEGRSLTLLAPETLGIGVDPLPALRKPVNTTTKLFFETSDEFFARHDAERVLGGKPVDVVFIDGMHLFEFALRDFRNAERLCGPDSVVLVHDCYPTDAEVAARVRTTDLWAGDTWKLIPCLKEYRPDLEIVTVTVGPTGLGLVRGLNPHDSVLFERHEEIVDRYASLQFSAIEQDLPDVMNAVPYDWEQIRTLLPEGPLVVPGSVPAARKKRRRNARIVAHRIKRRLKLVQRGVAGMLKRGQDGSR